MIWVLHKWETFSSEKYIFKNELVDRFDLKTFEDVMRMLKPLTTRIIFAQNCHCFVMLQCLIYKKHSV